HPTLGTNPHSWGFPTTDAIGYPIIIDWATSIVAMGRIQQFEREGKTLPEGWAVNGDGQPTQNPRQAKALFPFGAHKGYGLSLINELVGAFIGGSLPTIRSRPDAALRVDPSGIEKTTPAFFFQVIHPDALSAGAFAADRDQAANVKAVIEDVLGHGNTETGTILPGQLEYQAAQASEQAGGLVFTKAEIKEFEAIAKECGHAFDPDSLHAA
ncbi:MAG: Ldh family oxidoreductase, partial [Planctomycetota bacterium]